MLTRAANLTALVTLFLSGCAWSQPVTDDQAARALATNRVTAQHDLPTGHVSPSRVAFVFVNFDEREVSLSIGGRIIVNRQMLYDEHPEVGESLLIYVEVSGTSNAVLTIDGEAHNEQLFITPKTKTVYVRTIADYFEESNYDPLLD